MSDETAIDRDITQGQYALNFTNRWATFGVRLWHGRYAKILETREHNGTFLKLPVVAINKRCGPGPLASA